MPPKKIIQLWYFPSSSNSNKSYETLQYEDNSTSCQCPGWTRRCADDGSRTCKHTRLVDAGLAGPPAHDYSSTMNSKPERAHSKTGSEPAMIVRKVQWD